MGGCNVLQQRPPKTRIVPYTMEVPKENTLNPYTQEAIRLLAQGFSSQFAEEIASDERMHELMMELASEFVEKNIPIVKEEDQIDVAAELLMNVTVREV